MPLYLYSENPLTLQQVKGKPNTEILERYFATTSEENMRLHAGHVTLGHCECFMSSPNCDLMDYITALVLSNGEQKGQIFQ